MPFLLHGEAGNAGSRKFHFGGIAEWVWGTGPQWVPDRHEFFVQIPCGCGSVLFWRCCDTLCTSGFMDDVTFGPWAVWRLRERLNL